jgi:hypothetical protein
MDKNQETNNRRKLLLARLCERMHEKAKQGIHCDGRYGCWTCNRIAALRLMNGKLTQCLRAWALNYCGHPN